MAEHRKSIADKVVLESQIEALKTLGRSDLEDV
jgi:hypothetical protein